uniref:EGF-like domain-containing protein n=1 Tax=Plectus sambesii TaxID=2011161 RepID=A0A914WSN9_9BILA
MKMSLSVLLFAAVLPALVFGGSSRIMPTMMPGSRCGLDQPQACRGGSHCINSVCTCQTGSTVVDGECVVLVVAPPLAPCVDEATVCGGQSVCTDSICKCPPGMTLRGHECYRNNEVSGVVPPSSVACTDASHCTGGSTCVNGKCTCQQGMVLSDGWCQFKYAYPGETCARAEICVGGSVCSRDMRICNCPERTIQIDNSCLEGLGSIH